MVVAGGPDPEERRIGSVLRERYRITGVIGAGGMATVYLAVHRNGNRVALKMLHPELGRQAAHRERFVREAYVANSLDHPGAVRVLDDDVADDGSPFLVMELLVGETLAARLRRCGRLAPREVLVIGHALCDVLARAHARGVVHRDIKPDNLFLTTAGELKVLDFGIARVVEAGRESGTRTGHMLGTPAYMPPEQALGRRHAIDGRSDLWAVGATMFAAIAGRAVHQGDAPEELLVRSATEPAPGLASVAPEVPPAIAAVVDRALAFAPDQRFADAAAMQAAIAAAHRAAFGAEIEATPRPRGEPTPIADPVAVADTLASDPGGARTQVGTHASTPPRTAVDALGPTRIAGAATNASEPGASDRPPTARRRRRVLAAAAALLVVGAAAAVAWRAGSGCTTRTDCAGGEGPAICRVDEGRCVPLTTGACRVLADDAAVARDDTLWIGAMYPISDRSSEFGREAGRLLELAQRDFHGLTGGLPPTRPGGPPRPIGVILCDDTEDYEASAKHLVDEVGVPAVLGFGRSKEVLDLASRHFVPKGVLALASNPAAMLSSIVHPPGEVRLVYRVTTSTAMRAPPSVALLRQAIEPALRGPGGALGPEGTLRVAILQTTAASGTSYTDALLTELTATRTGGREEVRAFMIADDRAGESAPLERAAAEVVAFAPQVVLDGGAPSQLLTHIEAAWTGEPRPRHVYDGSVDAATVLALARARPDFSARFHMISNRDNPTLAKLRAHYLAVYGGDASEFSPTPYDAFYVLAYAAVAVGDAPLTGRALARAMPRLGPPGADIEVGPAGIYPALKALGRGENVDLRGTRTSLDFDPETGDATAELALFCVDAAAGRMRETDAHHDPATRSFTGAARCP